jgi:hypothetical protein
MAHLAWCIAGRGRLTRVSSSRLLSTGHLLVILSPFDLLVILSSPSSFHSPRPSLTLVYSPVGTVNLALDANNHLRLHPVTGTPMTVAQAQSVDVQVGLTAPSLYNSRMDRMLSRHQAAAFQKWQTHTDGTIPFKHDQVVVEIVMSHSVAGEVNSRSAVAAEFVSVTGLECTVQQLCTSSTRVVVPVCLCSALV